MVQAQQHGSLSPLVEVHRDSVLRDRLPLSAELAGRKLYYPSQVLWMVTVHVHEVQQVVSAALSSSFVVQEVASAALAC